MRAHAPGSPACLGLAAALAALAGGCHKDEPAPALGGYGQEAAGVICDKVYECCMPMELVEHMSYGGGRPECGRKNGDSLGFWAAVIEQEQTRGRLAFDLTTARHCLAAFGAATCDMHKRNAPLEGC